jgi:polyribonucleotide nucleotidyltransferase
LEEKEKMIEKVSVSLGSQELTIETGKIAKQADGSALVRCGDTVVLVTACGEDEPKNTNFLPLTCDYREYTYAAGKIPGGFFKREGRPTEKETLTSRLIDRPIRPLFPENYRCETQVIAMVLSAEPEINPDVLAMVGSSAALYCSDIPFHHPIAAVRVGLLGGELVVNPTLSQLEDSSLNLLISATDEAILMVEAGAQEVPEEKMIEALEFGHSEARKIIAAIKELAGRVGKTKREITPPEQNAELIQTIEQAASQKIIDAFSLSGTEGKLASDRQMKAVKKEIVESIPEEDEERREQAGEIFGLIKERLFRSRLLEEGKRPDGRNFAEIREITTEIGLLPRTHGSALFTRGETQALVTVTLGTSDDQQRVDGLTGDSSKSFMLHYNFPPFSVGEVRFLRGPGRREIGHGALADRAITPVLPADDDFPYTVRIVSDIMESNGSSSMASVCGGVLALQDAGVPLRSPVAGVAMGLVKEGDRYAILSDIAGAEDHYGDMDFKVTGTREGITALQMDIKITGVTREIMSEALAQAREGRLFILEKMAATIGESRVEISEFAPRIISIKIPVDKIGAVIGPGGKVIRGMTEEFGVKIDIEDDGTVKVFSTDGESAKKAITRIEEITAVPEVDKTYLGKVMKVVDFGAFVEILPGIEGLLHISEIAEHRIADVRDEVRVGDKILVKVLNVDQQGKIKLSRRAVLADQRGKGVEEQETRDRSPRPERQDDRGSRPNRDDRSRRSGQRPSRGRPRRV